MPYVLVYLGYLTKCRYAIEAIEHYLAGLEHLWLDRFVGHFSEFYMV